jgi:hypothetical protein
VAHAQHWPAPASGVAWGGPPHPGARGLECLVSGTRHRARLWGDVAPHTGRRGADQLGAMVKPPWGALASDRALLGCRESSTMLGDQESPSRVTPRLLAYILPIVPALMYLAGVKVGFRWAASVLCPECGEGRHLVNRAGAALHAMPDVFCYGFRELRQRVHRQLSPEIADLHASQAKIRQWDAFWLIFRVLPVGVRDMCIFIGLQL